MNNRTTESIQKAKEAAGFYAASLVEEGMTVGIGTGSTVAFFIEALGQRCREGLQIQGIATSIHSTELAKEKGIPLLENGNAPIIHLTVDGADEIDNKKNMIKGGGGALFREKLMAFSSEKVVIIIDDQKQVEHLGLCPLPVEIHPFLYLSTIKRLENGNFSGQLRLNKDHTPYVTDNGNYIYDISLQGFVLNPKKTDDLLNEILGVIETGLFFDLNPQIIVGHENRTVTLLP